MAEHLDKGYAAEELAQRFLTQRGLTILATNYRCRYGELDLVMRDAELLVIVEIRYRARMAFGGPIASISRAKQRKIVIATQHLIRRYPVLRNAPVRFDVIGLTGPLQAPDIHWIAGAFTIDDLTNA